MTSLKNKTWMEGEKRFESLEDWPISFISKYKAFRSGFYYTGIKDFLMCYVCEVVLSDWKKGDDPIKAHKSFSKECVFIKSVPNDYTPSSPRLFSYNTFVSRIRSFEEWPISVAICTKTLADAGFFYLGNGDRTMCYYCGGILRNWNKGDDPWKEHSYWFPACHYLRLIKGDNFIKRAIENVSDNDDEQCEDNEPYLFKKTNCAICQNSEVKTCFVPCGHSVTCFKCGLNIQKCPICDSYIERTMNIYFS